MARDHGFHSVRITRIIQETPDTRTYVLNTPSSFTYRAGQFVTVRARGTLRSYSMSSSPETDDELMVTVKRVAGGLVSNWMHDHLVPGDVVEVTLPAGVFCLRETPAPLLAFGAGSGITPILSLAKSALATTGRQVRVLAANRDAGSVIFGSALAGLAGRYPSRLEVRHHLDIKTGFVTERQVLDFVDRDGAAHFYLCGPAPFMDLVQRALLFRSRADLQRAFRAGARRARGPRAGGHGQHRPVRDPAHGRTACRRDPAGERAPGRPRPAVLLRGG